MRTERTGAGLAWALLSAATFGTSGSFARSLIDAGWSPSAAVIARMGAAALILAVPAVLALRGRWRLVSRNLGGIAGYGLAAIAGAQVCYFNALEHLSVGVALLLEYMGTVLVVGWMWLRHRQRPRRLTLVGAIVAFAGLALVLDVFGGAHVDAVGVLWGLGAAVGLAAFFVLSSRAHGDALPAVPMVALSMVVGVAALLVLGAVGIMPLHASLGPVTFVGHRMSWLVPVAGLSLIAAVVAYLSGIRAAKVLGARLASFVGLTEVMFAVLAAWLLLGQLPTGTQLAGGALIVAGIVLLRLAETPTKAQVVPESRETVAAAT